MADTHHENDRNRQKDTDDTTHRITPRTVDPDQREPGGGAERDRATGHDRDRSVRRDPEVVEAPGGDQAGIAGGGIDSDVSGRGGNLP